MALDPDSIVQQGIGLSLLTLKSFTPVIIFSDSDFKSSHNKNDYTCVMDSTLTITRPRSRITSHFVIQFWKVFNVHVNDIYTCLITINTLAYLIYLWKKFLISNENISENFILFLLLLFIIVWSSWFLFNFNFKKESKELYVVISCFLSLYCMFTVISNDNPDKTKTSASVTDSRVQTADIYFKYEIFYTIWLKIIFKKD